MTLTAWTSVAVFAIVYVLIATEWAMTADDVLWRRTKIGLQLSSAEARRLAAYMEDATRTAMTMIKRANPTTI